MSKKITLLLLFIIIGLCVLIAFELVLGMPEEVLVNTKNNGNKNTNKKPAEKFVAMEFDELSEMIERPLFSSTRRPALDPCEEENPPPHCKSGPDSLINCDLHLSGIVVNKTGDRIAMLKEPAKKVGRQTLPAKSHRAKQGEKLCGWNVIEVAQDKVTLENSNGDKKDIFLRTFKKRDKNTKNNRKTVIRPSRIQKIR